MKVNLLGLRMPVFIGKLFKETKVTFITNLVDHLYTSPTAIRSIRKEDSHGKFIKQRDLSSLKTLTCVG